MVPSVQTKNGYAFYEAYPIFLFELALRSESGITRSNLLLSDVRVEIQIAPLQSIDRQIVGGDIIDVARLILGAMQHDLVYWSRSTFSGKQ